MLTTADKTIIKFLENLVTQGKSKVSVKNYKSDIGHFLAWITLKLKTLGTYIEEASEITPFISGDFFNEYKNYLIENKVKTKTANRRLSTLRNFSRFLHSEGLIDIDFMQGIQNLGIGGIKTVQKISSDIVVNFRDSLITQKTSPNTIKNYAADVRNFVDWAGKKSISKIESNHIKNYREEVLKSSSASTFDRKMSSLKKFFDWAIHEGHTEGNPIEDFLKEEAKTVQVKLGKIEKERKANVSSYNSFQARIIAKLAVKPRLQKLIYHLFYTRPNWYRKYHTLPIASYFNYGILILLMSALGFGVYNQFFKATSDSLAYPTTLTKAGRYLSFQGRLTTKLGNPITIATDLDFKLYDASESGSPLWDSGTCSITPDTDGIFSTLLGDSCGNEIGSDVFSENAEVWLGVTVGLDDEATPRVQIATVAYALNSETLQGYPASESATANTVPVMNSNGQIVLAYASPKIQSTSGTFAIEGQTTTISTASDSNGSITINPDGTGTLNLIFEGAAPGGSANGFVNATNSNLTSGALYYGEVASDASGYNLIQLASGSTPTDKFTISSGGNLTAAGTINGLTVSSGTISSGTWNGTAIGTQYGGTGQNWSSVSQGSLPYFNGTGTMATLSPTTSGYVLTTQGADANPTWVDPATLGTNYWELTSNSLSPINNTYAFNVGDSASSSALFHVAGTTGNNAWFNLGEGNLGIGTTSPDAKLAINSTVSTTGDELITNGTFTGNANGWDLYDGAAYDSNNVTVTNTGGLDTSVDTISGKTYIVTFTLSGVSTDQAGFYFDNNSSYSSGYGNGTHKVAFTSDFTGTDTIYFESWAVSSIGTWTIDDVSIKESASSIIPSFKVLGYDGTTYISLGGDTRGNTGIGRSSLSSNTYGIANSAFGDSSLYSNAGGAGNSSFGNNSLYSNTYGDSNSAFGASSLFSNTTGLKNSAFGAFSLFSNTTGEDNLAIGYSSMYSNTTGGANVGIGNDALYSNTEGYWNSALGYGSLFSNTTGQLNVAIGKEALYSNTTAGASTAVGFRALYHSTGDGNTGIGGNAGDFIFDGTYNTFLGYESGSHGDQKTDAVNSMALGYNTYTTKDNQVIIGNDSIEETLLKGNVGIGKTPNYALDVNGDINASGYATAAASLALGNTTASIGPGHLNMSGNLTAAGTINGLGVSSGTITSGTWHGTAIGTQYGGTGADNSAAAQYSIPYYSTIGTLGGVLSPGTGGYVLSTNGAGGAPTWIEMSATGTSYWDIGTDVIFPISNTVDMLLGGSSTSSAKFAFKNIATGTPTASISGTTEGLSTYLDGNGNLGTTNMANLTLGTATTGQVIIKSANSTALTVNGANLIASGTFAMPSSNTLTGVAGYLQTSAGISVGGDTTYYINSDGDTNFNDITGVSITQGIYQVCDTSGNCGGESGGSKWKYNLGAISPYTDDLDVLIGNSATTSAKFAFMGVASGTPTASISGTATNLATYLTGDGNLAVTNGARLTLGGVTTGQVDVLNNLNLANTKAYYINGTSVLNATTLGTNIVNSSLTGVGALTGGSIASGFGTIATGNTITGTTINGTTGINTGLGAGTQRIDATGNLVNINDILASGYATISGSLALGNTTASIGPGHLNMSGNLTVGGITNFGGVPYTWPAADAAVSGYVLSSNTAGQLSWVDNGSGGSGGTWTIDNNGVIYPNGQTLDVLIGATATTSAKFAFKNVLTGTPTASISGSSANVATYLDGNGNLSTTNMTGLTIGSSTTGNVTINSRGSNALIANGANLTTGGTLYFYGTNYYIDSSAKAVLNTMSFTYATSSGSLALGNTSAISGPGHLNMSGNLTVGGTASVSGTLTIGNGTTNAIQSPFGPLALNYKSGPNAWSAGLTLTNLGNIGIGTTTPLSKLSVVGTSANSIGKAAFLVDQYENQDVLTASASGQTLLTLTNDGILKIINLEASNVITAGNSTGGIYNSFASVSDSPASTALASGNDLFVGGDLEIKGGLYLTGHNIFNVVGGVSTGAITLAADPTAVNNYNALSYGSWFVNNAVNNGIAALMVNNSKGGTTGDIFTASASGVTKLTLTNSGNLNLSGNFLPGTDNTYNIGASSSARFKDLFLGTGFLHLQSKSSDVDYPTLELDYALGINTSGNLIASLNGTSLATITQGGNFGIGTTSPLTTFDVRGTASVSGGLTVNGVISSSQDNKLSLQASGDVAGNGNNGSIYFLDSTGSTSGRFDTTAEVAATGGTITYDGDDTIHTFTSNGTFSVNRSLTAKVLVVGGGGGGANGYTSDLGGGGGGGGGDVIYNDSYSISTGNTSVTVGNGGATHTAGNSSVFGTITATGGGRGGIFNYSSNGEAGGSGSSGGGGGGTVSGSVGAGGTGTAGYNGGAGYKSSSYPAGGGGGGDGGAGQAGGSSYSGGNGGSGTTSSISGSSLGYGGGGGGAQWGPSAGSDGAGVDGGGNGRYNGGQAGTANRGGGGGGGGTGAAGGSGVVIIRYSGISAAYGILYIGGINTTSADLAEYYVAGDKTLEAGEVVSISDTKILDSGNEEVTNKGVMRKTTKEYDSKILGIISTKPGLVMGSIDGDTGKNDSRTLALSGRVPTKIAPDSQPIEIGDFLTSSETYPGMAKKATRAGYTIGKALETWDSGSSEKIDVFVNLGFFDPEVNLFALDNYSVVSSSSNSYTIVQILETGITQIVNRAAAFGDMVAANIKAGTIIAKNIVTDQFDAAIAIVQDLTAPKIATNFISPLPDEKDITIQIGNATESGKLIVQNGQGEEVSSFDSQGNATFSGTVESSLLIANSASVSGTLFADEIKSKSLDDIKNLLSEVETDQKLLKEAANWSVLASTNSANLDQLALTDLFVTNQAAINSLSVSNTFTLGMDIVFSSSFDQSTGITSNNIDTLSAPLRIQSLAMAPVEIMAGLFTIDTTGNVNIKGSLAVSGNLKVAGNIESSGLNLVDIDGTSLATIDASGAATFTQVSTQGLTIAGATDATNAATIDGVITTNATVGVGTIPAGTSEITIKNDSVTNYTLIYVTPTSSTSNHVLYVKSKKEGEFKIGFTEELPMDVNFNWWIVKTQ